MTKNKKQKAAVRSLMEATGAKYTSSLREVQSGTPESLWVEGETMWTHAAWPDVERSNIELCVLDGPGILRDMAAAAQTETYVSGKGRDTTAYLKDCLHELDRIYDEANRRLELLRKYAVHELSALREKMSEESPESDLPPYITVVTYTNPFALNDEYRQWARHLAFHMSWIARQGRASGIKMIVGPEPQVADSTWPHDSR